MVELDIYPGGGGGCFQVLFQFSMHPSTHHKSFLVNLNFASTTLFFEFENFNFASAKSCWLENLNFAGRTESKS